MALKTFNNENDSSIFFQYSQDITFDYTTGRVPTGNELDFYWENNYIPIEHTVNDPNFTKAGPHVWERIKVGKNGRWGLPRPVGINSSNKDGLSDLVIDNLIVTGALDISNGEIVDGDEPTSTLPINGTIGQILVNTAPGTAAWTDPRSMTEYTGGSGIDVNDSVISIKEDDIDHDALLNTHNLTTDIDHNQTTNYVPDEHISHSGVVISAGGILSGGGDITASRELTLAQIDIDHSLIANTHNLTSDIDHDTITNSHNLTTDIDHNAITNYIADEHIDWKSTTENLNTSGTLTTGDITLPNVDGTAGYAIITDGSGNLSWGEAGEVYTASNGLTKTLNDIQLGGNLTKDTHIEGNDVIDGQTFTIDKVGKIVLASKSYEVYQNALAKVELNYSGLKLSSYRGDDSGDSEIKLELYGSNAIFTGEKGLSYAADYSDSFGASFGDRKIPDVAYVNRVAAYTSAIEAGSLNNETDEILQLPDNRGARMKLSGTGNISKIILDIYDIGSNTGLMEVNFTLNGVDLLAADTLVITGENTFETLQNTAFTNLQEVDVCVRVAGGDWSISEAKLYIYTV